MNSTSYEKIIVEDHGFCSIIRMNRPKVKNAIDPGMLQEINDAIEEAERDDEKLGVVISSVSEEFFASGGDLKFFLTLDNYQKGYEMSRSYGEKFRRWERSPLLIVAAIEGYAIGGGAELTLVADIRVAGEGATMHFKQTRLGLITGWGGATRLVRLIGPSKALYVLATGARLDSGQLKELGIVDFVAPAREAERRAMEIIESLAGGCREGVAFYKKIVYDYAWKDFDMALELERKLFAKLWDAPRHREEERRFFKDK